MSHLSLEALARLIDEPASPEEAEHLTACPACRHELDAMREEIAALAELPDLLPPPDSGWQKLEERLIEDGLIATQTRPRNRGATHRLLRLAAGLALFLAGGVSGIAVQSRIAESGGPGTGTAAIAAEPGSLAEAAESLRAAEQAYLTAIAHYTELADKEPTSDPIARLAALEDIVMTTRAALASAPADPVINGYHLTALAQREATVKQIALTSADRWF